MIATILSAFLTLWGILAIASMLILVGPFMVGLWRR